MWSSAHERSPQLKETTQRSNSLLQCLGMGDSQVLPAPLQMILSDFRELFSQSKIFPWLGFLLDPNVLKYWSPLEACGLDKDVVVIFRQHNAPFSKVFPLKTLNAWPFCKSSYSRGSFELAWSPGAVAHCGDRELVIPFCLLSYSCWN